MNSSNPCPKCTQSARREKERGRGKGTHDDLAFDPLLNVVVQPDDDPCPRLQVLEDDILGDGGGLVSAGGEGGGGETNDGLHHHALLAAGHCRRGLQGSAEVMRRSA
jgi:hypothetical protein